MLGLNDKLRSLKEPIKVGLVGAGYMPHGLTGEAMMSRDVPKGKPLTYDDVSLDGSYINAELRM